MLQWYMVQCNIKIILLENEKSFFNHSAILCLDKASCRISLIEKYEHTRRCFTIITNYFIYVYRRNIF